MLATQRPRRALMSDDSRVVLGLILLPFIAAVLGFVSFPAFDASGRALGLYQGAPLNNIDAAISVSAGVFLVASVVTICGAPIVWWLKRRGPLTLPRLLVTGAIVANLTLLVMMLWIVSVTELREPFYSRAGALRAIVFTSYIGLGCAAVFWTIVSPTRRPPATS
jgi:hypothetical protein